GRERGTGHRGGHHITELTMIKITQAAAAVAAAVLVLAAVRTAAAADLRITDTRGREVVVAGAAIDYGGFMTDKETNGIRVLQGDGVVTVKWTDVESVKV